MAGYTDRHTDPVAEALTRTPDRPAPAPAPQTIADGQPVPRRSYPGRDAALAEGRDPIGGKRPAGT